jgi:carboxylesterase type B
MWAELVTQGELARGSTPEAAAERLAGLEMPQGLGVHMAGYFQPEDQTEDCLTLTIRAPVGADKMPVMVWIVSAAQRQRHLPRH